MKYVLFDIKLQFCRVSVFCVKQDQDEEDEDDEEEGDSKVSLDLDYNLI